MSLLGWHQVEGDSGGDSASGCKAACGAETPPRVGTRPRRVSLRSRLPAAKLSAATGPRGRACPCAVRGDTRSGGSSGANRVSQTAESTFPETSTWTGNSSYVCGKRSLESKRVWDV